MIINNLEESLREYCKTQDSKLFEESVYFPMKYLASSIVTKYKIKKDIEETINDMVSHGSVVLPEKYNPKKGKAKSMLYILMSQYLLDRIRSENRNKRNVNKTIFLEDMDNSEQDIVIEVTIDNLQDLKETLLHNRQLFNTMNGKLEQRIKDAILQCIEQPERYEAKYNSYTADIAKKTKTSINKVYNVIKDMHSILTQHLLTT